MRRSTSTPSDAERQWTARPLLATLVRIAVFALPIAVSVGAASAVAHLLPRPTTTGWLVAWWVAVLATSTLVLIALQRLARRMLPLVALLRLTLLFPDRAPKRFSLALRAGNTAALRGRLEAAGRDGPVDSPEQAMAVALALAAALSTHHAATRGHAERVRAYVELVAEKLPLSPQDREQLRWASLLHDIGKLSVSPALLGSPDPLDDEGWEQLKRHPAEGAQLTAGLRGWLGDWAPTIVQHHERWDGTGYPHGLAGENICLGARITAVADSFEVMTGARPYQRRRSAAEAREELARSSGTQFDPAVVRAFLNISLGKLERPMSPAAWAAEIPLVANLARIVPETAAVVGRVAAAAVVATAGAVGVIAATSDASPATGRPASVEGVTVTRSSGDAPNATNDADGQGSGGSSSGQSVDDPSTSTGAGAAAGTGGGAGATPGVAGSAGATTSDGALPGGSVGGTPTVPSSTTLPSPPLTLIGPLVPTTSPTITLPAVTVPPVTTPPTTLPGTTVPTVTIPPVTIPPVTTTSVTIPPTTLPPLPPPPTITLPPVRIT